MNTPAIRRPMTADERIAAKSIGGCTMTPASWDKRFTRFICEMDTITDKEAPQVWRLFIRYRRQISVPDKARLLALAENLSAPDLRKLEAARREQERIDDMKRKYAEAVKPTQ